MIVAKTWIKLIAIRSYPLTSVNTFTVATPSSHTNRYCFILVLKMSSVIELRIGTGSIFQVCNPKYVADLKKNSQSLVWPMVKPVLYANEFCFQELYELNTHF